MNIWQLCIKRPVLAIVISLMMLLFGAISLSRLPVRQFPDIDAPIVSVKTIYPGANAQVVERTVTEVLEDELTTIDGIKSMTSESSEGQSNIIIEYDLSKDIDVGTQDARDRVARIRGKLPEDIDEPVVSKEDADAQPILWLSLSGKGYSTLDISDLADRVVIDRLQSIAGVARVIIGGEREFSMRIWLDPVKLQALGVTMQDVRAALLAENIEIPAGRVEGQLREFTVRTLGALNTPEAMNALIIKNGQLVGAQGLSASAPIYLRDVGLAEYGPKDDRTRVRYNGKPAVGLGVVKQSKANPLEVAKLVKARLPEIGKELPPGIKMTVAFDSSTFIDRTIHEINNTLYQAVLLVLLVVWGFLRTVRATIIPSVAIPVSIVATFAVLDAMGFTINTLTLLALILAIGLVVDDAIVVLENVFRHIDELGESPMEAALKGTQEVALPVIATTVSLIAVFLPLGYMTGAVGRLFGEFAFAMAASVAVSMVVALTLTPMLCSRILKPKADPKKSMQSDAKQGFKAKLNQFLAPVGRLALWLETRYEDSLAFSMRHPLWIGLMLVVSMVLTAGSYLFLAQDFLPTEDSAGIWAIVTAPEGSTVNYTDKAFKQAEVIFNQIPELKSQFSAIFGPNNGIMFTRLKDWEDRSVKQQDIVAGLFPKLLAIPEAFVFAINPPSGPVRGFNKPLEFVIQGTDVTQLAQQSEQLAAAMRKIPGLINVDTNLKLNKPQLEIDIDRERAAALGVSARDIGQTLQVLLGGLDVGTFERDSKRYDVMVRLLPNFRVTPDALSLLYVPGRTGGNQTLVPLASVARWTETVSPKALNHYDRYRSATVSASLLPFLKLGQAMEKTEAEAKKILPPEAKTRWAGESREFIDARNTTTSFFLIAVLVVYLVLAAQFESFRDPFIILLTVPLAVCGAILTLFSLGNSWNVYSQIGTILLIGLVTKNGILIVEVANRMLEENPAWTSAQAAIEAARIRLRPIMMTAITTAVGTMPLATGWGVGGASRQSMGLAVVGGMIFSTLLTLYLVPVAYGIIKGRKARPN
ncbi:MAG: efflux RND transporter permease subunit [Vampirovibrionales bacterium]|nr:efflux RND transporter permease subunit [Vampirovibrionales bacterium]